MPDFGGIVRINELDKPVPEKREVSFPIVLQNGEMPRNPVCRDDDVPVAVIIDVDELK